MKVKNINLKNGFSLMEIVVIIMVIGVLLSAAFSILKGRHSGVGNGKTYDRLNQAYNIIEGYTVLNGNLPNIDTPNSPDNFSEFFNMKDGYGQNILYYPAEDLIHNTGADICNLNTSTLSLKQSQNGAAVTNLVDNVAFVVASKGADLKPQISINNNNTILTIGGTTAEPYDDSYKYVTLDYLKVIAKCPPPQPAEKIKILTDTLPVIKNQIMYEQKLVNGIQQNQVILSQRPLDGGTMIITNKASAKWCVDSPQQVIPVDMNSPDRHIDILPKDDNLISNDLHPNQIVFRTNGLCDTSLANYQGPHPAVGVVLNWQPGGILVAKEYIVRVHVIDATETDLKNRDIKSFKFVIAPTALPAIPKPVAP